MRNQCSYTEEEFKEAIKKSISLRQAMIILKVKPEGGNYKVMRRKIKLLNVDTSHIQGQGYLKSMKHNRNKHLALKDILTQNSTYGGSSSKLKNKLFDAGLLQKKCYKCNNINWLGKPISLELEHINGNNCDHRIDNLTILCPNCHSQTDTYRRRKDSL